MKKIIMLIALVFVVAVPVMAKNPKSPADENGLNKGNSNKSHLYLYEKDPSNWEAGAVLEGAWGKMTYDESGDMFNYVFNGHKLLPEMNYTLIYYPDPWPGEGLMCLGTNLSDEDGNVHIQNTLNTGDLPALYDWNHLENPGDSDTLRKGGAKIWLVLEGDVDCDSRKMTGWAPIEYLFEYDVIVFDDTDTDTVLETLENKDWSWNIIPDETHGSLRYASLGPTFDYSVIAQGLPNNEPYSLIYYADPGPGNHPGFLIGTGSSDGSGNAQFSGSVELNMNLPHPTDANYPTGAKIWLVPSSDYNESTLSIISWGAFTTEFLVETNFVNYIDTDL